MKPEELMRKYKYGYIHSCEMIEEPFVKDLLKENQALKKQLEEYQEKLEKADSITQSCIFNGKKESEISFRKCLNMLENLKEENQELKKQLEEKESRQNNVIFKSRP